jgi:hypothetical protein
MGFPDSRSGPRRMHIMVNMNNDRPLTGSEADQHLIGDHIALIYETPEERLSAVTPLIRVGLEKGEICLYISNEEDDTDMVEALKAGNIDVDKAIGNGGLILTHKKEMYFKRGYFDPDWTMKVIGNVAELAKSYGFTAMRIISDMTWTQEKVAGVEKWPEYEAKLNVFNPGISLRIICQYDRKVFWKINHNGMVTCLGLKFFCHPICQVSDLAISSIDPKSSSLQPCSIQQIFDHRGKPVRFFFYHFQAIFYYRTIPGGIFAPEGAYIAFDQRNRGF